MKKKNSQSPSDNFSANISAETITKAVAGDREAVAEVLAAYEPAIIAKSTTKKKNPDGTTTTVVDNDLAQTLREALIREIPNFRVDEKRS